MRSASASQLHALCTRLSIYHRSDDAVSSYHRHLYHFDRLHLCTFNARSRAILRGRQFVCRSLPSVANLLSRACQNCYRTIKYPSGRTRGFLPRRRVLQRNPFFFIGELLLQAERRLPCRRSIIIAGYSGSRLHFIRPAR